MGMSMRKLPAPMIKMRAVFKRAMAQGCVPARYFAFGLFFLVCNVTILRAYPSLCYLSPPSPVEVLGLYQQPPSDVALGNRGQMKSGQLQNQMDFKPSSAVSRSANASVKRLDSTNDSPSHSRFCDVAGYTCIFDVGHNTGQDTSEYLKVPNARVVAVEANPILVRESREKFKDQIASGSLLLLDVGITKDTGESGDRPSTTFWINTRHDKFSSFHQKLGCRNPFGAYAADGDYTHCESVEVKTMTCADLLKKYGTPTYMKIDIEGFDMICLWSIRSGVALDERPEYISVEGCNSKRVELLTSLGYSMFKVVSQGALKKIEDKEKANSGHSGSFGAGAIDHFTGKQWQTGPEILGRMPAVMELRENTWFDLHARKV